MNAHTALSCWVDAIDLYQVSLGTTDANRTDASHLAASAMWTYQFVDVLHSRDTPGLERFATKSTTTTGSTERMRYFPLAKKEAIGPHSVESARTRRPGPPARTVGRGNVR